MNITSLARIYFTRQHSMMTDAAADTERSQRATLASLLKAARNTAIGKQYDFASIHTAEDFSARLPLIEYEDIRADVTRMVSGEQNILWPGQCRRFAQSSGTSGGASKFIPLTPRSLKRCHFRGGSHVVATYLHNHPESRLFSGRSFILGGSYATDAAHPANCHIGDLSASLIDCINPIANLVRVPSKPIALMEDWNEKLPALVKATISKDVRSLSGVPSWFMTVIEKIMEAAGASELHQVWPNLEVFFHGGIAFGPYREQYNRLIDPSRMNYMETYNASEGFFALQDNPDDPAMLLLQDVDVFYEFMPIENIDDNRQSPLKAWQVKPGHTYALIITSSNGLWRYLIGDTVTVTSTNPLKIKIAGRTRSFINAFGEELMVHNADAAMIEAAAATGADVADYTASPVFATDGKKGHHLWLVEFNHAPDNIDRFTSALDTSLQNVNSDYRAKRSGNIFLAPPRVISLPKGTFIRYLAATGKLGGQRKVPRLKNDSSITDSILSLIANQ